MHKDLFISNFDSIPSDEDEVEAASIIDCSDDFLLDKYINTESNYDIWD